MAGNIPVERTSLVGRRAEVAAVIDLLDSAGLVTLTGPGGVGKTRVALRAARDAARRFTHGAWLVDIGTISNDAIIPHVVASTLQVTDQTTRPQLDVLADFLADRRLLLVLDGCERLPDGVALLVARLLAAAPGLMILATSRQPIPVTRGRRLPIGLLDDADSERLLRERATGIRPDLDIDHGDARELCRRLDGIPLAIELAARSLRALTMPQLLSRLRERIPLPPDETAPVPRHQTLTTTIGWSHQLCTPGERRLWARLSIFTGTFDPAAAAAVCGADLVGSELGGLADKSVLVAAEDRYRMLDTIREYGAGWLSALDEEDGLRLRHLSHFRDQALDRERHWFGENQMAVLRRLVDDHANLRAALDFGLGAPAQGQAALELAAALWPLWIAAGFLREGRYYLERALGGSRDASPARAKALWVHSWVAMAQGDIASGLASAERSGQLARGRTAAVAVQFKGIAMSLAGDPAAGLATLRDALRMHGDVAPGDITAPLSVTMVARGLVGMGLVAAGRPEEAVTVLRQVRAVCDARGEHWWASHTDWVLAMAELARGAPLAAQRHALDALAVKRDFADLLGIAFCLDMLAATAAAGDLGERAAILQGAVDAVYQRLGKPRLGWPLFQTMREDGEHAARKVLGDAAYERARTRGLGFGTDEAVSYALDS